MAEFVWTERLTKIAIGPALLCGWWYFAPDYSTFSSTPLGKLTIGEIVWHIYYLLLLVPWLYGTICWTYEAWTGRDSVWLWHP